MTNPFKSSELFKQRQGYFPQLLSMGVLFGFITPFPNYLNFDQGLLKDNVSLFFGALHGFGGEKFILITFLLSLFFFSVSFFNTVIQRASAIFAVISLILSMSNHYENQTGFDHVLILPSQFFILICLYHFFYRPKYHVLSRVTYPTWLFVLPSTFMTIHYFGSAMTKFIESGLYWGDGVSLMIWASIWSDPTSTIGQYITSSYEFSLFAQNAVYLAEALSILFLFKNSRFNCILAVALLVFHILNELLFHYGFWANCIYLYLLFIGPAFHKTEVAFES